MLERHLHPSAPGLVATRPHHGSSISDVVEVSEEAIDLLGPHDSQSITGDLVVRHNAIEALCEPESLKASHVARVVPTCFH